MKNTKGDKTRKKVVFLQTTFKPKLNIHKKRLNPLSKRQKPLLSYNQYYVK